MTLLDRFVDRYGKLPTETDPDYLEMLRMTKYRILAIPDVQPAKCANCGSCKKDERKYVDFGLQVDWYGVVYLCGYCLVDIAKHMGLFDVLNNRVASLEKELAEARNLNDQGVALHEHVNGMVNELKEYYGNVHSVGNDPTPDSSPSVELNSTESNKSGTSSAKQGITKSPDGSGRKDVPSFAELLNNTKS